MSDVAEVKSVILHRRGRRKPWVFKWDPMARAYTYQAAVHRYQLGRFKDGEGFWVGILNTGERTLCVIEMEVGAEALEFGDGTLLLLRRSASEWLESRK